MPNNCYSLLGIKRRFIFCTFLVLGIGMLLRYGCVYLVKLGTATQGYERRIYMECFGLRNSKQFFAKAFQSSGLRIPVICYENIRDLYTDYSRIPLFIHQCTDYSRIPLFIHYCTDYSRIPLFIYYMIYCKPSNFEVKIFWCSYRKCCSEGNKGQRRPPKTVLGFSLFNLFFSSSLGFDSTYAVGYNLQALAY